MSLSKDVTCKFCPAGSICVIEMGAHYCLEQKPTAFYTPLHPVLKFLITSGTLLVILVVFWIIVKWALPRTWRSRVPRCLHRVFRWSEPVLDEEAGVNDDDVPIEAVETTTTSSTTTDETGTVEVVGEKKADATTTKKAKDATEKKPKEATEKKPKEAEDTVREKPKEATEKKPKEAEDTVREKPKEATEKKPKEAEDTVREKLKEAKDTAGEKKATEAV
ncbi:hypothetical protein B9Z55_008983 [Caenorhabditis nigoni]|uniref:Uncharacterized protein n=1 Tax=Caenorhabditis nigoni TaxID=1611254 RepID=A0A2G5UQI8_9PELO|nr:hypothetical protein B9Z55_008983 [Caenorhabditis nigoni]